MWSLVSPPISCCVSAAFSIAVDGLAARLRASDCDRREGATDDRLADDVANGAFSSYSAAQHHAPPLPRSLREAVPGGDCPCHQNEQ